MLKSWFHIDRHVAFALLKGNFVGIGDLFANPACHVFGGGVEMENFVDIAMVEFVLHLFFDVGEVDNHSIFV